MRTHKTEEKPRSLGDYVERVVSFFTLKSKEQSLNKEVLGMEKLVQRKGSTLQVKIPAEVDHCFADEVREIVDRKLQTEDIRILEFDFRDTEFMDSSGIGLLMGRYKLMRSLGGAVRIVHAKERIRKILILSGIHKIIPIEKEF